MELSSVSRVPWRSAMPCNLQIFQGKARHLFDFLSFSKLILPFFLDIAYYSWNDCKDHYWRDPLIDCIFTRFLIRIFYHRMES
jgi:hypothetical protein